MSVIKFLSYSINLVSLTLGYYSSHLQSQPAPLFCPLSPNKSLLLTHLHMSTFLFILSRSQTDNFVVFLAAGMNPTSTETEPSSVEVIRYARYWVYRNWITVIVRALHVKD